jgi:hypothetical protein
MDILKRQFPIKSLIFLKSNCHAKMAPDILVGVIVRKMPKDLAPQHLCPLTVPCSKRDFMVRSLGRKKQA